MKPVPTVGDVYFNLCVKRCKSANKFQQVLSAICQEVLSFQNGAILNKDGYLADFITMLGEAGYPKNQSTRIAEDYVKTLALVNVAQTPVEF